MNLADCAFNSARLSVSNWRNEEGDWPDSALIRSVRRLLTPHVTQSLLVDWQRSYDDVTAAEWISDREAEGTVLRADSADVSEMVGLLLMSDGDLVNGRQQIRIGYMLVESQWGIGIASEMLDGLIAWFNENWEACELVAGVEAANVPSIRVLEKCGFERDGSTADHDALIYTRRVGRFTNPSGA